MSPSATTRQARLRHQQLIFALNEDCSSSQNPQNYALTQVSGYVKACPQAAAVSSSAQSEIFANSQQNAAIIAALLGMCQTTCWASN